MTTVQQSMTSLTLRYLKMARALSSSDAERPTSDLTRLEKVWYSFPAATFAFSSTLSKTFMLFSYTSSFLCSAGQMGGASLGREVLGEVGGDQTF